MIGVQGRLAVGSYDFWLTIRAFLTNKGYINYEKRKEILHLNMM